MAALGRDRGWEEACAHLDSLASPAGARSEAERAEPGPRPASLCKKAAAGFFGILLDVIPGLRKTAAPFFSPGNASGECGAHHGKIRPCTAARPPGSPLAVQAANQKSAVAGPSGALNVRCFYCGVRVVRNSITIRNLFGEHHALLSAADYRIGPC